MSKCAPTSPDEGDGAGLQLGADGVGGAALHRAVVPPRVEVELQQAHAPVTRELRRRQLDKLLHMQRQDWYSYFTFQRFQNWTALHENKHLNIYSSHVKHCILPACVPNVTSFTPSLLYTPIIFLLCSIQFKFSSHLKANITFYDQHCNLADRGPSTSLPFNSLHFSRSEFTYFPKLNVGMRLLYSLES